MARRFIQFMLATLAFLVLKKYRPTVVAITGSVGKTSTKDAVALVLAKHFSARKSERNLNTGIGAPLAIIGGREAKRNVLIWFANFFAALRLLIFRQKDYPKVLVLELGADRPGDIRFFTRWIRPKIGIITAVGEIPVHVEFYSGPEEVAAEKGRLVEPLPPEGWAILNFDDLSVYEMRNRTRAKVVAFGFGEGADMKISEYALRAEGGIAFKLEHRGSFVPVRMEKALGKPAAYAAAAAAATGVTFGLNLVEIADALRAFEPAPGRMRLEAGVKQTKIIDDTYNASPMSMHAALETLRDLPAGRRIAVLGDMSEIGAYATEAHQTIGHFAATFCDYIFAVGPRSIFIKEGALARDFPNERVLHFYDSSSAAKPVERILQPGDVVLIKGSRIMKMERVLEEIIAEPPIPE